MEKIGRKPDYFELALMKTLSKANEIGIYVNGVTIGSHSAVLDEEEIDVDELSKENSGIVLDQKTLNLKTRYEHDASDNSFSCAAKALWEMENIRRINVSDNINQHVLKLLKVEERLKSKMDDKVKLSKEEMDIKKLKSKINESSIHDKDLIVSQKILGLILQHTESKSKIENKTTENAKADDSEEIKLRGERMQTLLQIQAEYRQTHKQIIECVICCRNREKLIALATPDLQRIHELNADHNNIIEKVKPGTVEDRDVATCSMILKCVVLLADKLKKQIDEINMEENLILAEQQKLAKIEEELRNSMPIVVEPETSQAEPEESTTLELSDYVCQDCLDFYTELDDKLNDFTKCVKTFVEVTPKSIIPKLKIAINTPVNLLTSDSADHMQDNFAKILQLLRGKFLLPNSKVPPVSKELCVPFIMDSLSKRFIHHAETLLISSKPENAFRLASIIVALWIQFPDFGLILVAQIMKKCPYTIPAYWPHYEGQSDQDFYVSRGYKYNNDGTLEDLSSFLKRMTGIFMLYVAIIVINPPKSQPHPYGLRNAWKWFAAVINLEPRSDVTAALIHTFLEMAGYKLSQFYGSQFWKIVYMLNQEYFLKIEKVTAAEFRGPLDRLKGYLESVQRYGRFQVPEGMVDATFWY